MACRRLRLQLANNHEVVAQHSPVIWHDIARLGWQVDHVIARHGPESAAALQVARDHFSNISRRLIDT